MISLRYHLVTIVAIFLALALGLLAGSSFGQPALVQQLRDRTDAQLRRIDELRAEVDAAEQRGADLDVFAEDAYGYLVPGRLAGVRVVVLTQEGLPEALEASVLGALDDAGARVVLTLSAQPSLTSGDPEVVADLAVALGAPSAEDLAVVAGERLAARFAEETPSAAPDDDPLSRLVEAGFLAPRDGALPEETRLAIGSGVAVVVLGAPPVTADAPASPFAPSFVGALAVLGVAVVACEAAPPADGSWLLGLPTDGAITVASADAPSGATALVLGLRRLLDTGQGGAYGGDGLALPPIP